MTGSSPSGPLGVRKRPDRGPGRCHRAPGRTQSPEDSKGPVGQGQREGGSEKHQLEGGETRIEGFKEEEKGSRRGPRCALSSRSHGVLGEWGEEGKERTAFPEGIVLHSSPPSQQLSRILRAPMR